MQYETPKLCLIVEDKIDVITTSDPDNVEESIW